MELLDAKGINPDSIRITSEGRKVRVEFEPPNSQFYSHIILRICLPSRTSTDTFGVRGRNVRPSGELVFLRPIKTPYDSLPVSSSINMASSSTIGSDDECGDYEVTFAELGFLQVELDRPISDYTFQFLVYQDTQLRQITRPVQWNAGKTVNSSKLTFSKFHPLV